MVKTPLTEFVQMYCGTGFPFARHSMLMLVSAATFHVVACGFVISGGSGSKSENECSVRTFLEGSNGCELVRHLF